MLKTLFLPAALTLSLTAASQEKSAARQPAAEQRANLQKGKPFFGTASYYADKFAGKPTASGEPYQPEKFTAACNFLPIGTLIKVTNVRNKKTVVVRVNDRLHPKNRRVVDLSRAAASKLGFISRGLTQVRVDVLIPGRK